MSVKDQRRAPFCWQSLDDLHAIRANVPRANLSTTLAVYQALTELAAIHHRRGGRDGFVETRKVIADTAGVSNRTFDAATTRLEGIGLLSVEKRQEGTTSLPSRYCLTPRETVAPPPGATTSPPAKPKASPLRTSRAGETIEVDVEDSSLSPLIKSIFEHWRETMGKNGAKLTPERRSKIAARLRQGYTADQIKRAIDGCAGSKFHRDGNHDDLTLICRTGSKLESFESMPVPDRSDWQGDALLERTRRTYAEATP